MSKDKTEEQGATGHDPTTDAPASELKDGGDGSLDSTQDLTSDGKGGDGSGVSLDPDKQYGWEERFAKSEKLGQGAMGAVFRAWDRKLQRNVAVKVLATERGMDANSCERFRREASAMARLTHPNIVGVYDAQMEGDRTWIAMEYVKGMSLAQLFEQSLHTLEQMLLIMEKIARGVHHAHMQGIVHRDLKPGNILVTEQGEPKVADFGIAHFSEQDAQLTKAGILIGTPAYMSPEQAEGKNAEIDARTDVYALGGMLYRVLTGRPPHVGHNVSMVMSVIIDRDPIAPRKLNDRVSKDLEAICLKAMDKDKRRRYQTAEDFAEDLRRYRQNEPIEARPATFWYKTQKLVKRRKLLFAVIATATVAVLVSLFFGIYSWVQSAEQARAAQIFGQEVERIEMIMLRAYMSPVHNIEKEREQVRQRMSWIEQQMAEIGKAARGAGQYALGQGHFVLGENERAMEHLQQAWDSEYQGPEVAYALGQVYGEQYRVAMEKAGALQDAQERKTRILLVEQQYKAPCMKFLQISRTSHLQAPAEYVEALLAYYEGQFDQAIANAQKAYAKAPWLYQAHKLEGDANAFQLLPAMRARKHAEAEDLYRKATESYTRAESYGHSDPKILTKRCRMENMWRSYWIYIRGKEPQGYSAPVEAHCGDLHTVDPLEPFSYECLADMYCTLGEYKTEHGQDAKLEFEKALQLIDALMQQLPLIPADRYVSSDTLLTYAGVIQYQIDTGTNPQEVVEKSNRCYREINKYKDHGQGFELATALALGQMHQQVQVLYGMDPTAIYQQALELIEKARSLMPEDIFLSSVMASTLQINAGYLYLKGEDILEALHKNLQKIKPDESYHFTNKYLGGLQLLVAQQMLEQGKDPRPTIEKALAHQTRASAVKVVDWYIGMSHYLLARYGKEAQNKDPAEVLGRAREYFTKQIEKNSKTKWGHLGLAKSDLLQAQYDASRGKIPLRLIASGKQHAQDALAGKADFQEAFLNSHSESFLTLGRLNLVEALWEERQGKTADESWRVAKESFEKAQTTWPENPHSYLAQAQWYWMKSKSRNIQRAEKEQNIEHGLALAKRCVSMRKSWALSQMVYGNLLEIKAAQIVGDKNRNELLEEARSSLAMAQTLNPLLKNEPWIEP